MYLLKNNPLMGAETAHIGLKYLLLTSTEC
jgi:hypothetical protein